MDRIQQAETQMQNDIRDYFKAFRAQVLLPVYPLTLSLSLFQFNSSAARVIVA